MSSDDSVVAFLDGVVGVSLTLTGCYLLASERQRGNGLLLVAAGGSWLFTSVRAEFSGAMFAQWVIAPIAIGVLAVVLLRYPDAHLIHPGLRWFTTLLLIWLLAGRLVTALLWAPAWADSFGTWWPTVLRNPRAYTEAAWIYHGGCLALAAAFLVLVLWRLRRLTGLMRLRTWPLAVLGPAGSVAFGLTAAGWLIPLPGDAARTLSIAVDTLLLIIPLAFAVIALQQKFERAQVAVAVTRLGSAATPGQIRDALRSAVAEPQLELAFRVPGSIDWVDAEGRSVLLDRLQRDHLLVPLDDSDGHPLAVVVTERGLAAHRDVLDPVVTAVRLSLENVRLQAVASARLQEVTQSRRRLVLAGVEERRRIERDLHDGAQQRLLAVSASLSRARERAPDAPSLALLDTARDELRTALGELRELAAGLHPAVLGQSGLAAALGSVADRLPLTVRTEVEARRWPPAIELAAYFVICECLTNIVKHSGSVTASVRASQQRDHLVLTVIDDGVGGATPASGRGLAGLADRVAALGGTLSVDSAPGRGTRVSAALPCG